jgi:hypothetical protein
MTPVIFDPEARWEFLEAVRYYEKQKPGLGSRFRNMTEEGIQKVAENPFLFRVIQPPFRRYLLHIFPIRSFIRSSLTTFESSRFLTINESPGIGGTERHESTPPNAFPKLLPKKRFTSPRPPHYFKGLIRPLRRDPIFRTRNPPTFNRTRFVRS